jgi:hypothetical protein
MDANGRPETGEVVFLASELVVEGAIHEIGTRALVLEDRSTALALEVGGHAVTCPREAVAQRRRRSSRAASWPGEVVRRVDLARE